MGKGTDRMLRALKEQADIYGKVFTQRYGQQVIDILELPIKVILSPFTLPFDIAGSAPRGFGIPELASRLSFTAIFAVATIGTYDIALELGRKVLCQRDCNTCNGWQALRCTMCKGTGAVNYRVKSYNLRSGETATTESLADAIVQNRAKLVHFPSAVDLPVPLPSKDCPGCDGSGVMNCPECKNRFNIKISADNDIKCQIPHQISDPRYLTCCACHSSDIKCQIPHQISDPPYLTCCACYSSIMEPPWKGYNVMRKMDYPYENIAQSIRDPKVAAFWLITMPQILGGFNYDEDVKQKIWWAYKESMRYDQLRDVVAKRKPGWEHVQKALTCLDPVRARDDPVIVKNIPYYKAKKALEEEVKRLDIPPRPQNWGELDLPLSASSWTEAELKDPNKLLEMTTLLSAQSEMADKILDTQWEAKWRQDKLNDLLAQKLQPYIQSIDKGALPPSIIIRSNIQENKRKTERRRRWWFF